MTVAVDDKDQGFDLLVRKLSDIKGEVVVGWLDSADPYPDGTSVVTVMAAHEFGTSELPARAPLRTYFDGGGAKALGDEAARAMGDVAGGAAPSVIGERVGQVGVEGVRETIKGGLTPALKRPRASGGTSVPLIDTGHALAQLDSRSDID